MTTTLGSAMAEVWVAIDDLASLASTMEPEDQLDEEEVASGLRDREDRYDLTTAHRVISTFVDRAITLANHVRELVEADLIMDAEDGPPFAEDTLRLVVELETVLGDYRPDASAVDCPGCPCIWQGGGVCCSCGQGDEHP